MKKSIILVTAMGLLLGGCSSSSKKDSGQETIQSQYRAAIAKIEDCDYYETIYSVYSGSEDGTLTRESYARHYQDGKTIAYNFCFGEGSDELSEGGYTITEDGKQQAYYSYGSDIEYSGSMTITSDSIATPFDVDSWTFDGSMSSYENNEFDLYFYNEDDEMYMKVVSTVEEGMITVIKNYVSSDDSYEDPYSCAVTEYNYDASGNYESDVEEANALEGQPLSALSAYLPE